MELKEFFYIVRKRLFSILLITLTVTLATGVVSYFVIKPKYKVDISVIIGKTENKINSSAPTYNDVMMYQTMVKTYSKLTKSRIVAENVINELNLKSMKVSDLLSMITVTQDIDTQFLTITVVSKDPEQAMNIANQFAKSLKKVSIKINEVDIVKLIDEAQLPTIKDSPKPALNIAIACFLGIMISIGLVFLLEYLDNTIKTKEDVEKVVKLPVIGTITLNEIKDNANMQKKTAAIKKLKSQISEQFRTLRTNIRFSSLGDEIKSIIVTSSLPGEGKSTVISNLALAMASSGKKVVIMDCDFRKPNIHKRFSLSNSKGLTNILVQDKKLEEIIIATDVTNLYVLTSGPIPPNPSELLGSNNMKTILNDLINIFDIVLIDTPPILTITDAQILSALSQGTIIVSSYGKTEKNELLSAKENIDKVGGKILGVVINKIPEKNNGQYGDYYIYEK